MKLNRRQRRSKKNTVHRPDPSQSPQQQMKAFLKAPGKFHIVQLPDEKSFVVKVQDSEMGIFLTMCQQLRGVLGHCDAIPATPVEASVADTNQIAQSAALSTKRIREARQRQGDAVEHVYRSEDELAAARMKRDEADVENARIDAIHRSQKSGRHRAQVPETTFDRLVGSGADDSEEGAKQLAAMELAAAQDQVAAAQDKLEEANSRLRDAYERGGELHNRSVIERFAEKAGEAVAESVEPDEARENDGYQPIDPQWQMTAPGSAQIPDGDAIVPGVDCQLGDRYRLPVEHVDNVIGSTFSAKCPLCELQVSGRTAEWVQQTYDAHIEQHRRDSGQNAVSTETETVCDGSGAEIRTRKLHRVDCPREECGWSKVSIDKGRLAIDYGEHVQTHAKADGVETGHDIGGTSCAEAAATFPQHSKPARADIKPLPRGDGPAFA